VIAFAPLVPAAIGIIVAVRFNNLEDHWVAALVGWMVGWLFTLVAIARWETSGGQPVFGRPESEQPSWQRSEVIALTVILLAATLLRVVALEDYPIALHNDEMSCLLEARHFLESNTALFDLGGCSCPKHGLRRLFGVRPALLLLLLTTPFHWHLHFSRTGFHYMQAGSLTVAAILLFVVATDRRSPVLFGCAGVVTGIAWQTYYAAWLIPLILGAWTVARLLSDREEGKIAVKGFVVTMVLFIVTLAPLLAYYVERPDGATARPNQVFLFSDHNREHVLASRGTSDPVELLATNAGSLWRFLAGTVGDFSGQYGLMGRFIDPFLLPLFLAGLAYALTLVHHRGGQLLWIWFLGTMISGGLLTIDTPFSPRLIGITTVVLLFPALVIDRILGTAWIADRRWRKAAATLVFGGVLVGSTWWNLHTTFVRYPKMSAFSDRDYIVRLASDLGNVKTILNFSYPEKFDHQAYRSLLPYSPGRNYHPRGNIADDAVAKVEALRPNVLVIVPLGVNELYGVCDRVGGDPAGMVVTGEGAAGFEWCFVQ